MTKKHIGYSQDDLKKIKENLIEEQARLQKEISEPVFNELGDEVDDAVHEVEDYTVNKSVELKLLVSLSKTTSPPR